MMSGIAPYYKAVAGAVVAFLTAVITALDTGSHISAQEWITAAIALIVAGGAVFAIPNEPKTTPPEPTAPPAPPEPVAVPDPPVPPAPTTQARKR